MFTRLLGALALTICLATGQGCVIVSAQSQELQRDTMKVTGQVLEFPAPTIITNRWAERYLEEAKATLAAFKYAVDCRNRGSARAEYYKLTLLFAYLADVATLVPTDPAFKEAEFKAQIEELERPAKELARSLEELAAELAAKG